MNNGQLAQSLPELDLALTAFAPIGLKDLGDSALLDRVDTKYVINTEHLIQALSNVRGAYRVLSVGGRRLNSYQTLYFDTPDFDIYQQHHNGWGERYKVRARRYVGSDVAFFEVKHRTNRSRTIKSRLPITEVTTQINGAAVEFVDANTPFPSTILEPKLWNDYQRVTLVSTTNAERVTIDLNVEFGWEDAYSAFPNIAIIEVKQASLSQTSAFKTQLRQMGLRAGSFSKYCAGVYTLYHPAKSNNFKSYFRQLSKVMGVNADVALH